MSDLDEAGSMYMTSQLMGRGGRHSRIGNGGHLIRDSMIFAIEVSL